MKKRYAKKSFKKHKVKCTLCSKAGTRSHAIWKRTKSKIFFCNLDHRLQFNSLKKNTGLCGHKGCKKKATNFEQDRRYCKSHFLAYKAKKKITDTTWKKNNHERHLESSRKTRLQRYLRAWKILRVLEPELKLEDVCEKTSRNIAIKWMERGTLPVRNEANFRGLEHQRNRFDIDLLIRLLNLIIEWKLTLNTVSKKELAKQLKLQMDHIKNEGLEGYDHILVGVDGAIGTYNFLTFFQMIQERVNKMYLSGLKPVNFRIDIFNLVMDEAIARLKTVEHLFLTPTNDYTFEMVWGNKPILPPLVQEMIK